MTDTTDQKRPSEKLSPDNDDGLDRHLTQAIGDYLQWMKAVGYARKTRQRYQTQLNQFFDFTKNTTISWQVLFSSKRLEGFKKITGQSRLPAINAFSRYLFSQGQIPQPLAQSAQRNDLPQIYEDYLAYQQIHRQATARVISSIKRVLAAFDDYLQTHKIDLGALKIEQVDAFLAEFLAPFKAASCRLYRGRLRGFLAYLYHERSILKRDLASFVVSRREYAQAKPPKFLRPDEIEKLFAGLTLHSASDIRTYALSNGKVTVLYVQTLYTFWRWHRAPTPARLALCGLSLGLALLAKLSGLLLLPMLGALLLATALGWRPLAGPEGRRRALATWIPTKRSPGRRRTAGALFFFSAAIQELTVGHRRDVVRDRGPVRPVPRSVESWERTPPPPPRRGRRDGRAGSSPAGRCRSPSR